MLYGDYSDLIHRVNRLSECTDEAIRLIRRLIDVVLALLDDNDRIQSGIDTYNNAICILEDVLRTNEMLREAAEAYMCCSSAPGSVIDFGFRPQAIEQGEHEPKEKDDAAAMKVAERRKALAEALWPVCICRWRSTLLRIHTCMHSPATCKPG